MLNQRDPQNGMLLPARLVAAKEIPKTLKQVLVRFKALLEREAVSQQIEVRARQASEEVRSAITKMYETRGKTFAVGRKPEARRSQDSFIGLFYQRAELVLQKRVYREVLTVLDLLGAAERNADGQLSVLDMVMVELDQWQETFHQVDRLLARRSRASHGR